MSRQRMRIANLFLSILRSALLICSKKLFHLLHCLVKLADIRQINNTEVIRLVPVESLARHNKHLFLMKKIQANCSSLKILNFSVSIFGNI